MNVYMVHYSSRSFLGRELHGAALCIAENSEAIITNPQRWLHNTVSKRGTEFLDGLYIYHIEDISSAPHLMQNPHGGSDIYCIHIAAFKLPGTTIHDNNVSMGRNDA